MGANENLEVIEEYQRAIRDQDWERAGSLLADDAVTRMAGVPRTMGGVIEGREAILDGTRQNAGAASLEPKLRFADGDNVCVVGKMTASRFPGNQFLRSADSSYTTYQCTLYRIVGGKIAETTTYVNWLDPYVQTGIVDPSTLTT